MNKNILVVDDEQDMRDYLGALLQDNGYAVLTAADGLQAMERVKRQHPDLILLDLDMPEETGTGFYRKLRNHKDLRQIPVIVVSGLAGRHVAISRSVVVLDKPLNEQRLLTEVESALQGQPGSD